MATRSSLALLGVVSAVMATGAGYGIAMVMGQPFTTLTQAGRGPDVSAPIDERGAARGAGRPMGR